ncbi:hypothetical protein, partial [Paraburkholderia caribensis]|uniref:hypothetical protein n=1 Tax=Paraburkholderia caribensis TaxID=75105 RepID=UPI001CC382DE
MSFVFLVLVFLVLVFGFVSRSRGWGLLWHLLGDSVLHFVAPLLPPLLPLCGRQFLLIAFRPLGGLSGFALASALR